MIFNWIVFFSRLIKLTGVNIQVFFRLKQLSYLIIINRKVQLYFTIECLKKLPLELLYTFFDLMGRKKIHRVSTENLYFKLINHVSPKFIAMGIMHQSYRTGKMFPKWIVILRIVLGISLIIKGIAFFKNASALEAHFSENEFLKNMLWLQSVPGYTWSVVF